MKKIPPTNRVRNMFDHVQIVSKGIESHALIVQQARAKALIQGQMKSVSLDVMVCVPAFWTNRSARAS